MTSKECLKFLVVFQKETNKIMFKANLIINSYWFFFGLLMANCFWLQPSFPVSLVYVGWLLVWQFKMVVPCRAILENVREMSTAVCDSIDEKNGVYLKDSRKLRKYSEFISNCIEKSKRI